MAIKFSVKDQPKTVPNSSGKAVAPKIAGPDGPAHLPRATPVEVLENGVDLFEAAPKAPSRKRKSK